MEINKISDKYGFDKEEDHYVVNFGNVKKNEEKSVRLEVTDVQEAGLVDFLPTCGCTTHEKTVINKNKAEFKILYSSCIGVFNKTVVVKYNDKQVTRIILKGICS